MITIDLQARFSSQARVDHLQRLKVLLTSLDQSKGFSQKQDFTETLSAAVDLLKAQGVTNAYSQACALLSCFAGQVDIHNMSNEKDPQAWVLHCMKQALHEGVSKGAFHSLFESLEGLGRFDQPWPSEQSQINLLDLLAIAQLSNKPIQILCNQEGPVVMKLSREDLASRVGTATESVIRTLSDFKKEGLIEVKGSELTILHADKLANLKY